MGTRRRGLVDDGWGRGEPSRVLGSRQEMTRWAPKDPRGEEEPKKEKGEVRFSGGASPLVLIDGYFALHSTASMVDVMVGLFVTLFTVCPGTSSLV